MLTHFPQPSPSIFGKSKLFPSSSQVPLPLGFPNFTQYLSVDSFNFPRLSSPFLPGRKDFIRTLQPILYLLTQCFTLKSAPPPSDYSKLGWSFTQLSFSPACGCICIPFSSRFTFTTGLAHPGLRLVQLFSMIPFISFSFLEPEVWILFLLILVLFRL